MKGDTMSNKFVVILDDEDAALLKGLKRILGALKPTADEDTAAEQPAADPTTGRRRRAGADAGSSSTEPASDAGASAGPRRSRRSAEPEPDQKPAASEEPRRRRRTEEQTNVDRITDADLTKAASQAGEKLTPKLVMQILREDYGVGTVNEIPQDKRRAFLDTLKFEMESD